jgi:hypothetical protein
LHPCLVTILGASIMQDDRKKLEHELKTEFVEPTITEEASLTDVTLTSPGIIIPTSNFGDEGPVFLA